MSKRIGGWIGMLGVAASLTACFDGGGGSSAVPLKSEQDVMREISNVIALQGGAGPISPAPARTTGYRALAARNGSWGGPKRPQEVIQCDTGSYDVVQHFDTARNYPLLGITFGSDYLVSVYDDCAHVQEGFTTTETGRFEDGDNSGYRTGEDPELGYIVAGSGSGAFRIVDQGTDGTRFTARFRGRGETRDDATTHESRDAMDVDFALSFSGQSFKVSMDIGEDEDPLIVHTDFSGAPQTLSIDGPIRYSSDFCDGGRVRYDTVTPLTFGEDADGTFINGGELIIEAGSRSVTLVFHPNGDIDYTFGNGVSGTITRAELLAGGGEGECLVTT